MYQIIDSFYNIQKKWSKLGQKTDFWLIFEGFSLTPSYTLWFTPQFLRQMKGLIKIYNRGKFHLYSICGSQVINVQIFSWQWNIHEMAHFGGFWDHNFHKNGQIVLKYGSEVEHHKTKMAYE